MPRPVAAAVLAVLVLVLIPPPLVVGAKDGAMTRRRRLLQPLRLGVPDSDYRKGIATQIAPINLMNIANALTLMPNLGVRNTGPAAPGSNSSSDSGDDQENDNDKKDKDDKVANRDRAVTSTALTIRALGTLGRNFATNGLWGGAAKSSADFRAAADTEKGGGSSLASDARSISQPGVGRTTSKSSGIAVTSAQQVIYNETGSGWSQQQNEQQQQKDDQQHHEDKAPGDDHPAASSSSPAPPPPPSARARRYKVLIGATSDYSAAGDYRTVYASGLGFGRGDYANRGQRDYDYGQPRPIPEAARSTTRSSTAAFEKSDDGEGDCGGGGGGGGGGGDGSNSSDEQGGGGGKSCGDSSGDGSGGSNNNNGGDDGPTPPEAMRGEAKSRTTAVVSAPAAASRAAATHVVALGTTAARAVSPNDTFGGRQVVLPVTPERLAGSDTSGLAIGRSYRHQGLPGLSVSTAGGDAGLGPSGGAAGSSADVFNFATGTRSAKARSEFVAAAPAANVGLGGAGRRRRKQLRRTRRRRRT